jgi:hypothetical protein
LESLSPDQATFNQYRFLPAFFDSSLSERWQNADDCAHKTFVVLAWLEFRTNSMRISAAHATRG